MFFFGKGKREDINLIPEDQQTAVQQKHLTRGVVIFVSVLLALAVVYGFYFLQEQIAQNRRQDVESQIQSQTVAWQKNAQTALGLKNIRANLNNYKAVTNSNPKFEEKLSLISAFVPEKVQITNLALDSAGKVKISAKAASGQVALQYFETLKASDKFTSLKLENISKSGDKDGSVTLGLNFTLN